MNSRRWFILSVVANLALGALVQRAFQARPLAVSHRRPVRAALPAATSAAPVVAEVSTAPTDLAFDWAQLAAADFKIYRDNLRAVGCPEQTVRDIITAEINDQFLQRRRELLADVQRRFWDIAAKQDEGLSSQEWSKPLEKLNKDREALIADVLGDEPQKDDAAEQLRRKNENAQKYIWLPAEKRARLLALDDNLEVQIQAFWKTINKHPGEKLTRAEQSQFDTLNQARAAARDQLLTPEEKAELNLRRSNVANWAQNLSGFEPTETEWRAVAQARKTFDETINQAGGATKEERDQRQQAMRDGLQKEIAAKLGADRFAQYELAGNGSYQQTRRITHRYDLPDATAQQAYDLQRTTEAAARQLRDDQSLDPDARQAALMAIRQEAERSLTATLGAKVFGTYQKYNGDWLRHLAPSPAG